MTKPFRDGVGMERCPVCLSVLRALDDEPTVTLRMRDVEDLLTSLSEVVQLHISDCRERSAAIEKSITNADLWTETITRLEEACGRTVDQIQKAADPGSLQ